MKIKIKKDNQESSLKAVGALLIFLIVAGSFVLFLYNKETMVQEGSLDKVKYIFLAGGISLVVLLHLIYKPLKKAKRKR